MVRYLIALATMALSTLSMAETLFEFPSTRGDASLAMASGDMDGDDDSDVIFVSAERGELTLLENTAAGTKSRVLASINFVHADVGLALTVSDVDDDGDLDILLADAGKGQIRVFANDGRGKFSE
jgi:hypothetical protein